MNTYDQSRSESWELKATLSETYPIIESDNILDARNGELARVASSDARSQEIGRGRYQRS